MSLLAGGTADKLGNRYEDHWMVFQLLRAVEVEIESIHTEDPTIEKAECLTKRSKTSGSWTLNQLGKNEYRMF